MPNINKVLLLLVVMTAFTGFDILYLESFESIRIFNIVAEFLFALMSAILFLSIDTLKGKPFYHHLNVGFFLVFVSMFVDGLDQFHFHGEIYTALGEKFTMLIGFTLVFFGVRRWIVEYGQMNTRLEKQVVTDELTGLYNRRGMLQKFEAMSDIAQDNDLPLSFVIADLDDFKEFNDTLGHLAGDKFLKKMGASLLSMTSKNEIIGRWGGEEFAVCLLGSDLNQAMKFAEKMRLAVINMKLPEVMEERYMTLSLGVSQKNHKEPLMEAIKRADRSLYTAKSKGKNQSFAQYLAKC